MGLLSAREEAIMRRFAQAVSSYVAFIDKRDALDFEEFIEGRPGELARLHAAALDLLSVALDDEDRSDEAGEEASMDWSALRERAKATLALAAALGDKLGTWNTYREMFDPYGEPRSELTPALVGQDLSEVYWEVKLPLFAFGKGTERGRLAAIADWQWGFKHHWGEHLNSALRPLYWAARHTESEEG